MNKREAYKAKVEFVLKEVNRVYKKRKDIMSIPQLFRHLSKGNQVITFEVNDTKINITKLCLRNILIENRINYRNHRTGKDVIFNAPNIFDNLSRRKVTFLLFGIKEVKVTTPDEYTVIKFISKYKRHYMVPRYIEISKQTGIKLSTVRRVMQKFNLDKIEIVIGDEKYYICFGYRRIIRNLLSYAIVSVEDDMMKVKDNQANISYLLNNIRTKFMVLLLMMITKKMGRE